MMLSVLAFLALAAFGPCSVFGDLKLVAFVFRHGARTPIHSYPNDIYSNFTWDGLDRGALTSSDVQQMYEHGVRLGNTYKSLLAKEGMFRNYNLQAKSSIYERTFMSGLSFLVGFYPPNQDVIPLSLKWQPVPIYPIPKAEDYYIAVKNCDKLRMEFERIIRSPPHDVKQMIGRDHEMISVFEEITGKENMTLVDISNLFDTLKVQSEWNLTPPSWFKPSYWDRYEDYTQRKINTFTPEMKTLRGGPLITEIVDSTEAATAKSNHKKVFIYSGHDTTVSTVARALNIESQVSRVFDYGATFALELHKTGNIDEIRVKFYASADSHHAKDIKIPNCPQPCSLQDLKNLYGNLMIRNIADLCKV